MIKKAFFCGVILMCIFSVSAQKAMQYGLAAPAVLRQVPKQDKQRLLDEDAKKEKGRLRCAVLLPFNKAFPEDIEPEKVATGTLWRMKIEAEDAEAINLYLEDFQLPKGAELSFYTPDFEYKLPTILSDENPQNKIYVTDHLPGNALIVELFVPAGVKARNCFTIKDIGYMYRPLPQWLRDSKGFGHSENCEVNVNCPEGADWQNEKKGVARILLVANGISYYCSGSLINNARKDKTPYFLTANHCAENAKEEDFAKWKFYFNYESPSCANPEKEPNYYIATGSEKIACGDLSGGSDFLLLKLNADVASAPDLCFNGWNIEPTPANNGVGIHHPQGDIKKISTYTKLKEDDSRKTHWSLQWTQTQTNWGVTEPGSSGSPIFDQNRCVVGTLTGGNAECIVPLGEDMYGKMSYHWDKNGNTPAEQLKPWLDPDNTGITKMKSSCDKEEYPTQPPYVFPNPTNEKLTIMNYEMGMNIEIFDIIGRKVMSITSLLSREIKISHLAAGLYIVIIESNSERKTQKIIKI